MTILYTERLYYDAKLKRKIDIFMEKMRRYYIKMLAVFIVVCVLLFLNVFYFYCGSFSFPIFSTLEYVLFLNRNNQLYF